MLLRFRVSNFQSFDELQTFSMIKGKRLKKHAEHIITEGPIPLLKYTEIFGANAGGKSNLIDAVRFARNTILLGLPNNSLRCFCRVSPDNKTKPSSFEFEIKIKNKYYSYGFSVILSEKKLIDEWLYQIFPDKGDKEIFVRKIDDGVFTVGSELDESSKSFFEPYKSLISSDSTKLFLTEANRYLSSDKASYPPAANLLSDVLRWFGESLVLIYPENIATQYSAFITKENAEKLKKIIRSFGFGITDFTFTDKKESDLSEFPQFIREKISELFNSAFSADTAAEKTRARNQQHTIAFRYNKDFAIISGKPGSGEYQVQKLQFKHTAGYELFDFSEESEGTIRLLDLIDILFTAEDNDVDKIYLIDEISRSLHPQLTYKFVSEYLSAAGNHTQLIVTTHESHLLNLELLRRDEIWFVDKNYDGVSRLYPLDEFSVRFDKKIGAAYFDGRYGGIPLFERIYPLTQEKS